MMNKGESSSAGSENLKPVGKQVMVIRDLARLQ